MFWWKWYGVLTDRCNHTLAALVAIVFMLSGCGASPTNAGVRFMEPEDGQVVKAPVHVKMSAENFVIEPAGPIQKGHGHLHITVDSDCVAAGQVIPKDDRHIHYGKGETQAELQLPSGQHRLCLQAADGAHVALGGDGMRQSITITVE